MNGERSMKTSSLSRWSRMLRTAGQAGSTSHARRRRRSLALEALEERITLSLTPQMVVDINSGVLGSNPTYMAAVGSINYFVADDGVHGQELWRSDGTAL